MTRIVFISDTHNKLDRVDIPQGDILIHSGDGLGRGDYFELQRLNQHLEPYKDKFRYILYVPGNHDKIFEKSYGFAKAALSNATVLVDQEIVIDAFRFYGSPWQPEFMGWSFNLPRGPMLARKWSFIPDDTDVLITHTPPRNILDAVPTGHVGCDDLFDRILEIRPKIHCFGHVHHSYGTDKGMETLYINASICNEQYQPVNKPIVIDIDQYKQVNLIE